MRRDEMLACTKCSLRKGCKHVVPARGDMTSRIAFVGEAPGEREDQLGQPFVGRSGTALNKALVELGMFGRVRVLNAVRCRPPGNRTPSTEELAACREWLEMELKGAEVIICLGRAAQRAVVGVEWDWGTWASLRIDGLRRQVLAAWHPSYVLRTGQFDAWIKQLSTLTEDMGL